MFNSNKVFQILNLCFVKHWILNWQSFTENQEEITSWPPPPRQCQRSKFVILFKSSLHPYLSLHGKPFFFPDVLKIWSFQKKCTGIWSFLYYWKIWCLFLPKIWSYPQAENERWSFSKKYAEIWHFLQMFWKDGLFEKDRARTWSFLY